MLGTDGGGPEGGANIFGTLPTLKRCWMAEFDLPRDWSRSDGGEINEETEDDNEPLLLSLDFISGDPKTPGAPREPEGDGGLPFPSKLGLPLWFDKVL